MINGIITILWTITIYGLLWMPMPGESPSLLGQMDLLIHMGLFLLLGGLGLYTLKPGRDWKKWGLWGIYMVFVALTSELGQYFFPTRTVAAADLLANHLGLLGAVVIWGLEKNYFSGLIATANGAVLMLGTGGGVSILARIWDGNNIVFAGPFLYYGGIIAGAAGLYFIFKSDPGSIWKTISILGSFSFLVVILTPSHPLFLFAGGTTILIFGLTLNQKIRAIKVIRRHLVVPFILCWYFLGILPVQLATRLSGILIIHVYFFLVFTYCLQKRFNYLRTVIPEQVSPE